MILIIVTMLVSVLQSMLLSGDICTPSSLLVDGVPSSRALLLRSPQSMESVGLLSGAEWQGGVAVAAVAEMEC